MAVKHLLDIPELPEGAFRPVAGRMRLFGKSDAPAAPDYIGQARQTAQGNLDLARTGARANRINQQTPYGSIKYTQGTGFDQDRYNRFLAQQADIMQDDQTANRIKYYQQLGTYIDPNDSFLKNPDQWSSTIELSPEQQQQLSRYNYQTDALGWAGMNLADRTASVLNQPLNIGDIPGLVYGIGDGETGGQWDKYSGLLMQRLNPDLNTQQAALDTKLANQGLTAGSEGWSTGQQQFAKQRNDANIAAQLAGANLAMQGAELSNRTRQQGISERVDLRNLPLRELQAVRSTAGVTNPTFSQPGQQQLTAGADLLGASGSQYGAAMNAVNAQNQQAANTTSAGVGLIAAAASFY